MEKFIKNLERSVFRLLLIWLDTFPPLKEAEFWNRRLQGRGLETTYCKHAIKQTALALLNITVNKCTLNELKMSK